MLSAMEVAALPGAVVEAGIVANCAWVEGEDESRRILVVGMKVVLKDRRVCVAGDRRLRLGLGLGLGLELGRY